MSARPWYETAEPIRFERHKLPDGSEIVLVDEWPQDTMLDLFTFEHDVPPSQKVMRIRDHSGEVTFDVHNGHAIYKIGGAHPANARIYRLTHSVSWINRGEIVVQPRLPGVDA